MIDYIHAAAYVGILSTLLYIPVLCYFDIKHRSIPSGVLIPLTMINFFALAILYSNGLPPMYLLLAGFLTVLVCDPIPLQSIQGCRCTLPYYNGVGMSSQSAKPKRHVLSDTVSNLPSGSFNPVDDLCLFRWEKSIN